MVSESWPNGKLFKHNTKVTRKTEARPAQGENDGDTD